MGLLDSIGALNDGSGQDYSSAGLLGLLSKLAGSSTLGKVASGLNNWVGNTEQSPLFSLGMGLMGAAQPFANPSQQIMGARSSQLGQQQTQQQMLQNQLYLRMLQQQYPGAIQGLNQLSALMNGGQPDSTQPPPGLLSNPPAQPQSGGGLLSSIGTPAPASPGVTTTPYSPPTASVVPPQAAATPQAPQGQQQQSQSQPVDPFAIMRAAQPLLGSMVPGVKERAQGAITYAQSLLANDPRYLTQAAAAKSPLAVAQAQYQQALAGNDPDAAQRAFTNLRSVSGQQHIGSMSGIMTMQLPNGNWATVNPSTGLQTIINPKLLENAPAGAEWLPGEVNAIRTRAAAEAGGEGAGQAPYDLVPVVGPDRQTYMVPKSVLLGGASRNGAGGPANGVPAVGAAGGTSVPGNVPAGAVGVSRQSPEQSSQQTAAGTGAGEELTELNKQADSARQANYTLNQLRALGQGVSLGPAAPAREWFEQVATPLAQAFGMQPPKELGNYQQINKFGNTLAFNAARAMGSREAAQIVQLQISSNPNKGLVSDAYNGLIDSMHAMNNYVLAKNAAIQAAASGGQITARQATANWETGVEPTVWDLAVSPQLASRFSGRLGADKIAKAVPFMSGEDAVGTMRNIPAALQAQVLRALPPAAKQEILMGLQSRAGATGTF